jgi:outer membrane protein assembly factor BamA
VLPALAAALLLAALAATAPAADTAPAPENAPAAPANRPVIGAIEVQGNTRMSTEDVVTMAGLRPGDPASALAIQGAAERLRRTRLFRSVEVHTRPGERPGRLTVVFAVSELRPSVRLGVGYEDLSGWYLIPVQLNLDNLSGHGERLDLSTRLGFRLTGLVLTHRRPALTEPRHFWELALRAESQNRIYFHREVEVAHRVAAYGIDLAIGCPLSRAFAVTAWASYEKLSPDSTAEVHDALGAQDLDDGDELAFGELPPGVQAGVTERTQTRLGLATRLDTRAGGGVARRGLWGQLLGEAVIGAEGDFQRGEWDLRAYLPLLPRAGLAIRTRLGGVTRAAPFYQRYYLGGLYTVRGFPSQSLSPAHGHRQFAAASLEWRAAWIGPPEDPLLSGLLFLDYGVGWDTGSPDLEAGATGIGWGFRLRVPWIGSFGIDVGRPVTPTPVDDAFHLNGSIGWSF